MALLGKAALGSNFLARSLRLAVVLCGSPSSALVVVQRPSTHHATVARCGYAIELII